MTETINRSDFTKLGLPLIVLGRLVGVQKSLRDTREPEAVSTDVGN